MYFSLERKPKGNLLSRPAKKTVVFDAYDCVLLSKTEIQVRIKT